MTDFNAPALYTVIVLFLLFVGVMIGYVVPLIGVVILVLVGLVYVSTMAIYCVVKEWLGKS